VRTGREATDGRHVRNRQHKEKLTVGAGPHPLYDAAHTQVPKLNTHAYGFYEVAHDLNSSKEVSGNPTEFYRRMGVGHSWGGGLKLGAVRGEYARDCNTGKGNIFVRFGERF